MILYIGFQMSADDSGPRGKLYRDAIGAGWASFISVVASFPILLLARAGAWDSSSAMRIGIPIVGLMLFLGGPVNAFLAMVLGWRLHRGGHPSFWKPLLLAIPGVLVSSGVTLYLFRDFVPE